MKQIKKGDKRVQVRIPLSFTYADENNERQISSRGLVENISINGMQVNLPLSKEIFEHNIIDFDLELPKPFSTIKGQGEIRWKRWDADQNCTTCGLKLEPMTLEQLMDIDTIVDEVNSDEIKHSRRTPKI
ncbi:PilZ domain-containing protein [bacterium]|nr:PilZ domain-containing protein [bacterium]